MTIYRMFQVWLGRLLDVHVCEEFTQWTLHQADFSRPTSYERDREVWLTTKTIEFTSRWQERRCTICGHVEVQSVAQH